MFIARTGKRWIGSQGREKGRRKRKHELGTLPLLHSKSVVEHPGEVRRDPRFEPVVYFGGVPGCFSESKDEDAYRITKRKWEIRGEIGPVRVNIYLLGSRTSYAYQ